MSKRETLPEKGSLKNSLGHGIIKVTDSLPCVGQVPAANLSVKAVGGGGRAYCCVEPVGNGRLSQIKVVCLLV